MFFNKRVLYRALLPSFSLVSLPDRATAVGSTIGKCIFVDAISLWKSKCQRRPCYITTYGRAFVWNRVGGRTDGQMDERTAHTRCGSAIG